MTALRRWRIIQHSGADRAPTFTRLITALLSDEEYGAFQVRLASNPELGALIRRGGGIRKVRVAIGSPGKSGGQTGVRAVKKEMFEELLGSVREAGAILRGQKPPQRLAVNPSSVRIIRERTSLSQSEFAHLIGVSVNTLQNWEQERTAQLARLPHS